MIKAVEAVIDEQGNVRLLQPIEIPASRRAVALILDDEPRLNVHETALLSEQALSEDWNNPEEDAAWSHLQSGQ